MEKEPHFLQQPCVSTQLMIKVDDYIEFIVNNIELEMRKLINIFSENYQLD